MNRTGGNRECRVRQRDGRSVALFYPVQRYGGDIKS